MAKTSLTLGPVLFNWPVETWQDFYYRIADEAPVDTVYVGEVVCSKRAPFFQDALPDVIERLEAGGKKVVVSTLALVAGERDMKPLYDMLEAGCEYAFEANDMAVAAALAGRPHVVGPFVNVYNETTLRWFIRQGASRVVLPAELPRESIQFLGKLGEIDLEVQAFGRLPLAISARCYHARAHGLHKDGCQFICGEDLDGLEVRTLDDQAFLTVNGTQTLSQTYCSLLAELGEMKRSGIKAFRLWPHTVDMVAVAKLFRAVLDETMAAAEADIALRTLMGGAALSNGFYHGTAGLEFVNKSAYDSVSCG